MANSNINKVVYGNQTLIDLTTDTLTAASQLQNGIIAHDRSGAVITGTNTYDANTSDATVAADEILYGETAYANGNKITGTMPNIGAQTGSISTKTQEITISQGYHDGSGKISISSTEQAKIIAENIKEGVVILGVTGTVSPASGVTAQAKNATPYTTAQTITPDSGYDYLSQVSIAAIAYVETANSYGTTVTIGTVAP